MIRRRLTNSSKQRGAALIVVLWVAILLSVLMAGALSVARTEVRAAHSRSEQFKARMAAESGLDVAAYLMALGLAKTVKDLPEYTPLSLNGYALSFETPYESQKLDINLSNEQKLQNLFVFFGLDQAEAQSLAARVADWRDRDDLARPNGAETRDYASARNGEKIGNRPFHAPRELLQVLNFPDDLYECIAPALTVLSATAEPDRLLMVQLYGDTPFTDQQRHTQRLSTSSRVQSAGVRIAVQANAESTQGRRLSVSGLFRVTGNPKTPYEAIAVYRDMTVNRSSQPACRTLPVKN